MERMRGKKDAMSYLYDSYSSTRSKAYKSRHANQNQIKEVRND